MLFRTEDTGSVRGAGSFKEERVLTPEQLPRRSSRSGTKQLFDPSEASRHVETFMNCVGIGHPFLSFDVTVTADFMRRHKLLPGYWYNYENRERINILHEALANHVGEHEIHLSPGGRTLIIARIIQKILHQPKSVVFLGARCMDKGGNILLEACKNTDICYCTYQMMYGWTSLHLTLHCEKQRCEVTYKSKHPMYEKVSFVDTPLVTQILEKANIFYVTDSSVYMLGEAIRKIAYFCSSRFKVFCLVLTNTHNIEGSKNVILKVMEYSDVVFMEKKCAMDMIRMFGIPIKCKESMSTKAKIFLINDWVKQKSIKSCTVITTDGVRKAYVASEDLKESELFYSKYNKNKTYVPHNPATYGFVGGFMAMMLLGHSMEKNIQGGFYTASLIAESNWFIFSPLQDEKFRFNDWLTKVIDCGRAGTLIKLPFTIFRSSWRVPQLQTRPLPKITLNES